MVNILLAEDNIGDVLLVQEALSAFNIENNLHVVADGQKAMQFLATMDEPGSGPRPDLMLLDLNLPKADGATVLAAFRGYEASAKTPVIVVTSSDAARDRRQIAALGVAHYFRKPSDFDQFMKLGEIVKSVLSEASLR